MKKYIFLILIILMFTSVANAFPIFSAITGDVSGTKNTSVANYGISVSVTLNNYSGISTIYGTVDGTNFVRLDCYSTNTVLTGTKIVNVPAGSAFAGIKVIQQYHYHGASRAGRVGTGRADINWR